jgi:hypothetical protein
VISFVMTYFLNHWRAPFAELRQLGVAAGCFAVLMIPVVSRLWYLHQTQNTHIFSDAPTLPSFLRALGPGVVPFVAAGLIFVAAIMRKLRTPDGRSAGHFIVCATLGVVPAAILYLVSVNTPIHVFVERYEGVAVPGIALCWAWIFTLVDSRMLRVLACVALVAWSAYQYYTSPFGGMHGYSWKYALAVADANASRDAAPILMCSDLPEADFHMPSVPVADSALFSPISYYKVHTTVVPMPRALNEQAQMIGRDFLLQAAANHQRFLAMGFGPSYPTLQWLIRMTAMTHTTQVIGTYQGIAVIEFDPTAATSGY